MNTIITNCGQKSAGGRLIEHKIVMLIASKPIKKSNRGFALILTLAFLLVSLIIFGSIMYWVSTNAKITLRNNQFNSSEYAAEAAVEKVLAQMERDFLNQSLTSATWYATSLLPNQTGWPIGYRYSDNNGVTNQITVNLGTWTPYTVALDSQYSQYAGLYGFVVTNTISATATPANATGAGSNWVYQVPATVTEQLQLASIPIFQFAIFYNINLEINAAVTLNIQGPVFSNAGIWTGDNITYFSTVTAVGTVYTTASDPWANYSSSSGSVFKMKGQPSHSDDALTMPIAGATNSSPTNVEAIINLPPSAYALGSSGAYSTNGQLYLANEADLLITNTPSGTNSASPTGTNIFVYFQDQHNATALTLVTPDYYQLKKPWNGVASGTFTNYITTNKNNIDSVTNVQFASYSFLTNVLFYDWREGWNGGSGIGGKGKTVQAIQFDVSKFNIWVTNTATNGGSYVNNNYNGTSITDKGHPIDSVYIYNFVPLTTTTLPAVRVVNGQQLPSSYGFTVATAMPLYVKGDYNVQQDSTHHSVGVNSTTYTYPAGFMADAITILSSNWNDTVTSKDPSVSPSTTTINAACLEGIVPSNLAISGDPSYSGGVENFLRMLEKWGTLYYNGSIVVMFPSQYATNRWQQTGNYYTAPTRDWAFDTNFTQQAGLPPLTPQIKTVIRGQWTAN